MKRFIYIILLISNYYFAQSESFPIYETFENFYTSEINQKDKVYVINFWATWCAPCVKELPYFEEAHEKLKDKNIEFILVSLDFKKNYKQKLIPFLNKKKLQSKVILLTEGNYNNWLNKVDENWSGSIPATWIIKGTQKKLVEHSFKNAEELEEFILNN